MSVVTPDGGLTGIGYALFTFAAVVLLLLAALLPKNKHTSLSTKQLVFCGTAAALAFLTSYIKLFELPFGGSITLFSMLFICLTGYWYGIKPGL